VENQEAPESECLVFLQLKLEVNRLHPKWCAGSCFVLQTYKITVNGETFKVSKKLDLLS